MANGLLSEDANVLESFKTILMKNEKTLSSLKPSLEKEASYQKILMAVQEENIDLKAELKALKASHCANSHCSEALKKVNEENMELKSRLAAFEKAQYQDIQGVKAVLDRLEEKVGSLDDRLAKDNLKDAPKAMSKNKELPKDTPKETPKDNAKTSSKKNDTPKDSSKNNDTPKDHSKDNAKASSKKIDAPKDNQKPSSKKQDAPKVISKASSKDNLASSKDTPKAKEASKSIPKEGPTPVDDPEILHTGPSYAHITSICTDSNFVLPNPGELSNSTCPVERRFLSVDNVKVKQHTNEHSKPLFIQGGPEREFPAVLDHMGCISIAGLDLMKSLRNFDLKDTDYVYHRFGNGSLLHCIGYLELSISANLKKDNSFIDTSVFIFPDVEDLILCRSDWKRLK